MASAQAAKSNVIPLRKGATKVATARSERYRIPVHVGELWTSKQRQMHPVHYAISYRASFKPELPAFFIDRYLKSAPAGKTAGNRAPLVLDPFGGRGTTVLQANLMGCAAVHNDVNPVAGFIAAARGEIPPVERLVERVRALDLGRRRFRLTKRLREDLLPFFHPDTLQEILNLRAQLTDPAAAGDAELRYLGMTALSRLYGHSDGFFSVYTFPQISIMPGAQRRNNERRNQKPEYRDVAERIERKLRRDLALPLPAEFYPAAAANRYLTCDARDLAGLPSGSVDLVITSPPFLDKVDYLGDNWMRAWFLGLEEETRRIEMAVMPEVDRWQAFMRDAVREIGRVLRPGGRAVIEVGEVVSKKTITHLEEVMLEFLPLKLRGGRLEAEELFINQQTFTKLANCWDVSNNSKGTNTNRCLVIRKR